MRKGWRWLPLFLLPCLLAASPLHAGISFLDARVDAPGLPSPSRYILIGEAPQPDLREHTRPGGTYQVEPVFSPEFPKTLARDVGYAATSPGRWGKKEWLTLGLGTAGVVAVGFADRSVHQQVQHIQNDSANDVAGEIRHFGGAYAYGTLGLFLAGGEVFDSPRAKATFIDGAAASLVSGGIALALKYAVGRSRPSDEVNTDRFQPFGGEGQSFPSGETTQAFAVASAVAAHYDELWIKASAYGVASLVGFARIYQNGHWASDVVAGALIGAVVGHAMVRFNDRRREKPGDHVAISIEPLSVRGGTGVCLVVTTR